MFQKRSTIYKDKSIIAVKDHIKNQYILATQYSSPYLKNYKKYFNANNDYIYYISNQYSSPIYFKSYKELLHNLNNFSQTYNLDINLKYFLISYQNNNYIIDKKINPIDNLYYWLAKYNIETHKTLSKKYCPDVYWDKKLFPGDSDEFFEDYELNHYEIKYIQNIYPKFKLNTLLGKGTTRVEAIEKLENYYKALKEYHIINPCVK